MNLTHFQLCLLSSRSSDAVCKPPRSFERAKRRDEITPICRSGVARGRQIKRARLIIGRHESACDWLSGQIRRHRRFFFAEIAKSGEKKSRARRSYVNAKPVWLASLFAPPVGVPLSWLLAAYLLIVAGGQIYPSSTHWAFTTLVQLIKHQQITSDSLTFSNGRNGYWQ